MIIEPTQEQIDATVDLIRSLSELNPSGDRHGMIDPQFTAACAAFSQDKPTCSTLTLEEWKNLRERSELGAAFARDITDATDPFVFLAVLRDRLVHSSGCADAVITMLSHVLDPHIDARTMTWKTGEEPPKVQHLTIEQAAALLPAADTLDDTDDALDHLFDVVDQALWAGDEGKAWPHIETWLETLDPEALSVGLVVGVLSTVSPLQTLPWYATWFERAKASLEKREPAERIPRLLGGFEPK